MLILAIVVIVAAIGLILLTRKGKKKSEGMMTKMPESSAGPVGQPMRPQPPQSNAVGQNPPSYRPTSQP